MANIAYPTRIHPSELSVQLQTTVSRLRSPYAVNATQLISRGVAWWVGTITWGAHIWDQGVNPAGRLDDITGFLDACEGGLHTFDIALQILMKGRDVRFPTQDESDITNSVRVISQAPVTTSAAQIGLSATLELTAGATATTGLRKGDWISLHNADLTEHRGAYRAIADQVGNAVPVAPAPPRLASGESHRVVVREPTLRARLSAPPPAVVYQAEWFQPITIQWEQAV